MIATLSPALITICDHLPPLRSHFSNHTVDAVIPPPPSPLQEPSQAQVNMVSREPVFKLDNANICHTPGSFLLLQSNAPRLRRRAETKQPCRAHAMFAMFTTRRTHSLVQCEATFTYTHARANTMDTAATVTEPLVTPFWGLSVVQVINTDLHILFCLIFLPMSLI